jgi:hypothetical protein
VAKEYGVSHVTVGNDALEDNNEGPEKANRMSHRD